MRIANEAEKQEKSKALAEKLVKLLWPVLVKLKQRMDRRLVKTFPGLVMVILMHRHCNPGLLLSDLRGYLLEPEQCQAGTKRISNLLHGERWEAVVIEEFLWQRVEELWAQRSTHAGTHALVDDPRRAEKSGTHRRRAASRSH